MVIIGGALERKVAGLKLGKEIYKMAQGMFASGKHGDGVLEKLNYGLIGVTFASWECVRVEVGGNGDSAVVYVDSESHYDGACKLAEECEVLIGQKDSVTLLTNYPKK